MPILSAPLIVLDTETTGFPNHEWSRVIELAAVLLDVDGNEVDSWSSLVLPDILDERADGALAINHITREMLEGQPSTEDAAASFASWVESSGNPKATAFNIRFDRAFLEKMGLTLEWAPCVMERAMRSMNMSRWPKLSVAAEHFNVTVEGDAHRALTDARTAARIAVRIQEETKAAIRAVAPEPSESTAIPSEP